MYEELCIIFKDGTVDNYSPVDELSLTRINDYTIKIGMYGTLQFFTYTIDLDTVESISIKCMSNFTHDEISSLVIFDSDTDGIFEFDNLDNSNYGILKRIYGDK